MKYKNIIFDVGGVLLSYRWLGIIQETIPDEAEAVAFAERLYKDPLWLEFDIELRPFDDVVEDYVKKYPDDEEHIRYVMGHLERMPVPRKKVWVKMHELKQAGYRLYLLSNYSSRMFHTHTDGLPFLNDIDGHVISYEVHMIKPKREIYEALFEKYGLDPSESLYFDDRQENVDGGRKLGLEGRVIYSEETLLGYLDRLLAPDYVSNPFHDVSLPRNERIDWLLSNMTPEEKIIMYSHPEQGAGRLGVEGFVLGGEASHGVEARNDQNGIGEADITTSFPNPIGMSSSWDPELIEEAGRITGTEARACFIRHRKTGLSRWAPTIDPGRDPRWGRNEECYGEDAYLAAVNAGAYIRGLQGRDPLYIRCGATLKHFYANNTEKDRFFSNSSVGMRDKFEYYLLPFKTAIEDEGALGVMTAYNKINGIPGMTDPEVETLLKDRYGLTHAVTDGFALVRLRNFHHEYGTYAECLAASVKAGVDFMNERPEDTEPALREALELGLLSEEELDKALYNILMAGMKLGVYDPENLCPYNGISPDDIDTPKAREVCRRLSGESIVLLENKNGTLPISRDDSILLAGPCADVWHKDWYAGNPPFCHTVREGFAALAGKDIKHVNGLDIYRICSDGRAWKVKEDGFICLTDKEDGDLFYIEDHGEGYHTIRCVETGKYVQSAFYGREDPDRGLLLADREDLFDWFTTCRFHMENDPGDGSICIRDRFAHAVSLTEEGILKADGKLPAMRYSIEKISDGTEEALKAAESFDTVVLVLGCNPLIPAREDYDRTTLALPSGQQRLLDAFAGSGKKVITVLLSNYPYTMEGAEKKTDALLLAPTGSEYMGDAVAAVITGEASPAGRLVQGWPASEELLPDMNDYRIIGKRTCRYVSEGWLYPFGYGLSYGEMRYSGLKAEADADTGDIIVSLTVENRGRRTSDEVIQIYAGGDFSDEKFSAAGYGRRLAAFARIRELKPSEKRLVSITVKRSALQIYDVVREEYMIYGGSYHIYAGRHIFDEAVSADILIEGSDFAERDLGKLTKAYACDDYDNTGFVKGAFGMTAAKAYEGEGSLIFLKSRLPEKAEKIRLLNREEKEGSIEVLWNGKKAGFWKGCTSTYEKPPEVYELPTEHTVAPKRWESVWTFEECSLDVSDSGNTGTLELRISGDVKVSGMKCI